MQNSSIHRFAATIAIAVFAFPAFAWNKAGHMVSAAIAYQTLKKDGQQGTIDKTIALLKKHPYYERKWKDDLDKLPEDQRDEVLFMFAAKWADDARQDRDFNRDKWHYINFPFKPEGQPAVINARDPAEENILRAYKLNSKRFKDEKLPDADRAVALTWLFHLIGDVHQPLHTVSLFTEKFPEGDRGGTKFFIKAKESAATISLHQLWDDAVIGSSNYQTVRNRAAKLRNDPELAKDKLKELKEQDFEKWANESVAIAREVVYLNGKLEGAAAKTEVAPVLPEGYTKKLKEVGNRRIVLAGFRISEALK